MTADAAGRQGIAEGWSWSANDIAYEGSHEGQSDAEQDKPSDDQSESISQRFERSFYLLQVPAQLVLKAMLL